MRTIMKRSFNLLIIFISVVLLLSGCSSESKSHVGLYDCVRVSNELEEYEIDEIYPEGCSLELMDWGQAWLELNGETFYCRWDIEGERLKLDFAGEICEAQLKDGACTIYFGADSLEHVFIREGVKLPKAGEAEETGSELSERQLFWNGDWYGQWFISNASGKWLDQSGQSFDCFARFDVAADGSAVMIFWDELQSADEPIAKAELLISNNAENSAAGTAVSTGGVFLLSELEETQWSIDPNAGEFDSFFVVENAHYEGEDGSFDYSIYLRPWGRTWEDINATQPGLLPYFYYDWYLPMLAQGESMPDKFSAPDVNVIHNTWVEPETETE